MSLYSGMPLFCSLMLVISCALCLYRVWRGPNTADRIAAVDILGILIISFCAIETLFSGRRFLMDIALSWAILGFVGTIALAKYLEGKNYDE